MSINANNAALNEILEAINELPEAGNSKEEQSKTIDITENGTTMVTPDEGMTLSEVTVNVEVESSGGGGGLTIEGIVAGTEPSGDIVIGAVTPRQGALARCSNITSLTLDGTIFASGSVQPFTYLGGMHTLTLKNTSGTMPALAIAYASNGLVIKIIGSCATLSSNAFSGFGANHRNGVPVIYVPWAEDDPMNANAPWGATKATIKYNTTYDANDNPIETEV